MIKESTLKKVVRSFGERYTLTPVNDSQLNAAIEFVINDVCKNEGTLLPDQLCVKACNFFALLTEYFATCPRVKGHNLARFTENLPARRPKSAERYLRIQFC
jgi:hypothetical protein